MGRLELRRSPTSWATFNLLLLVEVFEDFCGGSYAAVSDWCE